MKKYILSIFIFALVLSSLKAQELNLDVKVNYGQQLQLADPSILSQMETQISEFFNNNRWTEDEFEEEEKIQGNIIINITKELAVNRFEANIRIQTIRPVYKSNYTTQLFGYSDNVNFTFEQFQRIENSATSFVDNFSSVLTFYAYVILGYDYDSFSENGGTDYFKIADQIVNSIPTGVAASDPAWTSLGTDQNRYWLIQNILSPSSKDFRKAMYTYHREGLDLMHQDYDQAQTIMMNGVALVDRVFKNFPRAHILKMFCDTKGQELVEIFKVAERNKKNRVHDILVAIDPARANIYSPLGSKR